MSQGDKNTAITTFHKHGSKNQESIPLVYMQQDLNHDALTYIHYDLQPYKEVDLYQWYQHNYTTETDPLHHHEYQDDNESIPSLLGPGENEDFLSDDKT